MKGMTMEQLNFTCAKCGSGEYETDEFRVKGGTGKIFDVRSKRFTTVTCKRCNYTEIYKGDITNIADMFDSFVG
jgi:predicted nucleic-acid-binding Zn-ribbon protein